VRKAAERKGAVSMSKLRKKRRISKGKRLAYIKRSTPLYLMLIPAVVIVFIYCYIPMAGNIIAFQKFSAAKGLFSKKQTWVGLDNFIYIFKMKNTYQVLYNTVFISISKIILSILIPLIVALLLNEIRKAWYKRLVQTIVYFPYFISWVILGGILFDILSPSTGIVNSILGFFHIGPIYFLGSEKAFPWVVIISDTWKNYGFNTILYLAAITSVSQELYESAAMDGAGIFKRMWHVTIPCILPIIILTAVLSMGSILNAGFEQIYNLATPTVYSTGDIIDTLVYRMSLGAADRNRSF
jgi:putative aldouronate transport system permease protein